MNATIENLRIFLEERHRRLPRFADETMVPGADVLSSQLTKITQQIFPTVLHEKPTRGLWLQATMVRLFASCSLRLLEVDNDRLKASMHCLMPHGARSRDRMPRSPRRVDLLRGAGGISTGPTFCKASSSRRDQPG
ncbi:MAG: hypothetical protein IPJ48_00570 [Propionivibrio sp.]|uniref:Uncharacterized protein n=1 Tax=Candidatus Propionivibrio dominans TaxID=2954373 RepID=A0A9D7FAY8_9RHOO|nr:hypothetical protein [Candidatus Propionivibrio dominans]